jgi:hypothetical protein
MRENFKSGSVRGLIATLGLLPQKKGVLWALLDKRKGTVEWHFGNIKQNLKFREFHTRGLENVRIEPTLVCMANNQEAMWGKLGGSVAAFI